MVVNEMIPTWQWDIEMANSEDIDHTAIDNN